MLICIIYLMANFSMVNKDNIQYKYYYSLAGRNELYAGFENGYNLLSNFFSSRGFEYLTFRYCFIAIFTILLFGVVNAFVDNCGRFYLVYLAYPIIRDAEQIRFFAASVIVFWGLYFLFKLKGKKRILIYLLFIFLAMQFHQSVTIFAFVIVYAAPKKYHKNILTILFMLSIAVAALGVFGREAVSRIIALLNPGKAEWYSRNISRFGFLVPTSLFLMNAFVYWMLEQGRLSNFIVRERIESWIEKPAKIMLSSYTEISEFDDVYEFVNFINILALLTVPLLILNNHFYRIGRCIFAFTQIFLPYYWQVNSRNNILNSKVLLALIIIGYYIFDFTLTGSFAQQFIPFFIG